MLSPAHLVLELWLKLSRVLHAVCLQTPSHPGPVTVTHMQHKDFPSFQEDRHGRGKVACLRAHGQRAAQPARARLPDKPGSHTQALALAPRGPGRAGLTAVL